VNVSQLKLRSEKFDDDDDDNNKLQMGCNPVAGVIMHVRKYEIKIT
jgi:hypothetical protein